MTDLNDAFIEKINETLKDLDRIEDFYIDDTDDPEVIDITIRGRLKQNIGQKDPVSDYDRAMKGINPLMTPEKIIALDVILVELEDLIYQAQVLVESNRWDKNDPECQEILKRKTELLREWDDIQ
jgi:predicted thioredoxin/glutaredoxin